MTDDRPVIAVIGASGSQGGSVVRALVDLGAFRVRALSRNPETYRVPADEVVDRRGRYPELDLNASG